MSSLINHQPAQSGYAVCIKNDGYPASLELRKLYKILDDERAARHHLVRVIDESGEDYLFPEDYFVAIELPPAAVVAFSKST